MTFNVVYFGVAQGWWGSLPLAPGGFMSVKVVHVQRSTDVSFHSSLIMTCWLSWWSVCLWLNSKSQWGMTHAAVPWKGKRILSHLSFKGSGLWCLMGKMSLFLTIDYILTSLSAVINQVNTPGFSNGFINIITSHQMLQSAHHPHNKPQNTLLCSVESLRLTSFAHCPDK